MNGRWTDHILLQLKERSLSKELIEDVLNNPVARIPGNKSRIIYQKLVSGKSL